eukprot:TRINITY_DN7784_c0_g1_i1.p1 TRINITY_DN7784_c0_g1~~TRINITY_DN7784_c0_g1_i1.p1  ORF type:complete len:305 (+),score=28.19 TRINITY_DN7784_c0_g1_i1:89-1003(+)
MSFNTTSGHPEWIFVDKDVKVDWGEEYGTWAVSRLILSGFYSILFIVAIYMISVFKYQSRIFVVALFCGIAVRMFAFIVVALARVHIITIAWCLSFFLLTVPSLLYFWAYFMLLYTWTRKYQLIWGVDSKFTNYFYLTTAGVLLVIPATLYILDFVQWGYADVHVYLEVNRDPGDPGPFSRTPFEVVVQTLLGVLYVFISSIFFFFGCWIRTNIDPDKSKPMDESQWLLSGNHDKIASLKYKTKLMVPVMIIFLCRSILSLVTIPVSLPWWVDFFYYIFLEGIPTILMLKTRENRKKKAYSLPV